MATRNADLGEFEQLVLLAVLRLGDEAYAPRIAEVLESRAGREMSRGTLYGALDRLERKGFLGWSVDSPTARRGGRRKRLFRVTTEGRHALVDVRRVMVSMWEGMEELLPGEGV